MHSKIQYFYMFIKILHQLSKFDLLSGINIQYLTNDDGNRKKDIMGLITKPDWWTITIHFNVYDQGWRPMTNDLPFMIYWKSWARTLNYKTRIQFSWYVLKYFLFQSDYFNSELNMVRWIHAEERLALAQHKIYKFRKTRHVSDPSNFCIYIVINNVRIDNLLTTTTCVCNLRWWVT